MKGRGMKNKVSQLKNQYFAIRQRLPWLDAWRPPETVAVFPDAPDSVVPSVPILPSLEKTQLASGVLAWYRPQAMTLSNAAVLAAGRCPLVVKATEVELDDLDRLAGQFTNLTIIYASGDRKILYDFAPLLGLLKKHDNFHLVTANLCNSFALERMECEGLAGKLLYGSFMPFLAEDTSMGQLILSNLSWPVKCAIAGNNLRKILGFPAELPAAIEYRPVSPFIIDAHAHTNNTPGLYRMPVPSLNYQWPQWQKMLDTLSLQKLYVTPSEAIRFPDRSAAQFALELCRQSHGRMRFFEVFNPNAIGQSMKNLENALPLPECVGIKIHPASHQVFASDERYDSAFAAAKKYGKPLLTHSWETSSYNPAQKFSCPGLFMEHLRAYPEVTFVLGHAGGRAGSFPEVLDLCRKYANVVVDISGDYFHNGMIGNLVSAIGTERILFGSDIDWIDPRCIQGMVLAAQLTDEQMLDVFKRNAERIYQ